MCPYVSLCACISLVVCVVWARAWIGCPWLGFGIGVSGRYGVVSGYVLGHRCTRSHVYESLRLGVCVGCVS